MKTLDFQRKWGMTSDQVEAMRERHSGSFTTQMGHMVKQHGILVNEHNSDIEVHPNIVTNEGLNSVLEIYLNAGTQITTWYLSGFTANVTPLATHTYAVPGITELTTVNVAEAVRETYNANAASGQSIDNVAGPVAQYIADASFTFWGALLLGGGTNAFGHVASGTLWASSLLGSSKSMVALDTIDLTYTFTAADV